MLGKENIIDKNIKYFKDTEMVIWIAKNNSLKEKTALDGLRNQANIDNALTEIRQQLNNQETQNAREKNKTKDIGNKPHTFKKMFEPDEEDNLFQKLAKWYLKPRENPATASKVLEKLQVHKFQELPKMLAKLIRGNQTTYTIADSRLSSLIDYGAFKSAINEVFHLGLIAGYCLPDIIEKIASGNKSQLIPSVTCTLLNAYCILAQRLSRARCEKLIDKKLKRGKTIDHYEYVNILNLRLPE